jgi:single-stranded DNA-binding protein
MNSCILMAEIIQDPQLRYTSDNQTPIAEMLVQFPGLRDEDPPATLKVVGWGNLAQEIQEHYHTGDHVVIEGRLGMNMIDRPEGFKEKRAELTAQRIHRLEGASVTTNSAAPADSPAANSPAANSRAAQPAAQPHAQTKAQSRPAARSTASDTTEAEYTPVGRSAAPKAAAPEQDFDDIPF